MPDRDTAPELVLATPGDILTAVGLLTRLPLPYPQNPRGAAASWAYPLAGFAPGLIATLVALAATNLPAALTAGLALAALIITTGALHEDGLADAADGLWGGWTPQKRLEIMKDSHIGTYGVIALVLSLGLRWAAMTAIASHSSLPIALILTASLSRAPMVWLMFALPNARQTGLSKATGRPSRNTTLLAFATTLPVTFIALGLAAVPLALILTFTTLLIAAVAKKKIGGQTGDILGATQQISEIAILAYLLA